MGGGRRLTAGRRSRSPGRSVAVSPRLRAIAGRCAAASRISCGDSARVLIRAIALDCGYSSASLSERIYSGPERAGVLIYTAVPTPRAPSAGSSRSPGTNR